MKREFMKAKLIQFVKFGLVGASNTLIYLIVYYILIMFQANYLFASISGYLLSSLSGYILNKLWVFKDGRATVKGSIVKYYIVYSSSMALNLIAMYLLVDLLNVSDRLAPILTLCITVPYNFIFSKLWTFKERTYNGES